MKESYESVMEIHDDDPDHFELLLKYVYTYSYDTDAINKLSGEDRTKRLLIPIGVHALADKYDLSCIRGPIAEDLRGMANSVDYKMFPALLSAYYSTAVAVRGPVGEILTSWALNNHRSFVHTEAYKQMVASNHVFGADMALALERDTYDIFCSSCLLHVVVRHEKKNLHANVYCPWCKRTVGNHKG
jgi:hypothetical protein